MSEATEEKLSPPEIRITPDNRLSVAYNQNCTQEEEVRTAIVHDLVNQSERGGRSVCPRCDQVAIRYVLVKTTIGTYAIGACENCGYWFLM